MGKRLQQVTIRVEQIRCPRKVSPRVVLYRPHQHIILSQCHRSAEPVKRVRSWVLEGLQQRAVRAKQVDHTSLCRSRVILGDTDQDLAIPQRHRNAKPGILAWSRIHNRLQQVAGIGRDRPAPNEQKDRKQNQRYVKASHGNPTWEKRGFHGSSLSMCRLDTDSRVC